MTDLRDGLEAVLQGYRIATLASLRANHPMFQLICNDLRQAIETTLPASSRYSCVGSVGKGNWATIPWIAIFDKLITTSAQSGYYPVFLFRHDGSGVYLSLNQGVTDIEAKYRSEAGKALRARASDLRAQLEQALLPFDFEDIDLRARNNRKAELYEAGNIFSVFYAREDLPTTSDMEEAIRHIVGLYDMLNFNSSLEIGAADATVTENVFPEDLRRLGLHRRIERNASLVRAVKRVHGTRCMACEVQLSEIYGEIAEGYIEAHHLVPLFQVKGTTVKLDPQKDFAVLCPNCHAIVHRMTDTSDIAQLKRLFQVLKKELR